MTRSYHSPWLDHPNVCGEVFKLWGSLLCSLQPLTTSSLSGPNILLSTLFINTVNQEICYCQSGPNNTIHRVHNVTTLFWNYLVPTQTIHMWWHIFFTQSKKKKNNNNNIVSTKSRHWTLSRIQFNPTHIITVYISKIPYYIIFPSILSFHQLSQSKFCKRFLFVT